MTNGAALAPLCSVANFSPNPQSSVELSPSGAQTGRPKLVPNLLGMRIEIPRHHRRVERPVMHRQRKIMLYQRNLIGFEACTSNGATRPHCGHCRSSKTTSARVVPFGGRSASGASSANAGAQLTASKAKTTPGNIVDTNRTSNRRIFIVLFGCASNSDYSIVTNRVQSRILTSISLVMECPMVFQHAFQY